MKKIKVMLIVILAVISSCQTEDNQGEFYDQNNQVLSPDDDKSSQERLSRFECDSKLVNAKCGTTKGFNWYLNKYLNNNVFKCYSTGLPVVETVDSDSKRGNLHITVFVNYEVKNRGRGRRTISIEGMQEELTSNVDRIIASYGEGVFSHFKASGESKAQINFLEEANISCEPGEHNASFILSFPLVYEKSDAAFLEFLFFSRLETISIDLR